MNLDKKIAELLGWTECDWADMSNGGNWNNDIKQAIGLSDNLIDSDGIKRTYLTIREKTDGWEVEITYKTYDLKNTTYQGKAGTLPEAICQAWIKYKEGEKKSK
jgi:hypothetical protein